MKNQGGRTKELEELVNSLTSPSSSGPSDSLVKNNELKKTQVYWRNRSPENPVGLVEEAVDLVIPSLDNASRLLRFIDQLEETLHDHDTYGSIMRTVPF